MFHYEWRPIHTDGCWLGNWDKSARPAFGRKKSQSKGVCVQHRNIPAGQVFIKYSGENSIHATPTNKIRKKGPGFKIISGNKKDDSND